MTEANLVCLASEEQAPRMFQGQSTDHKCMANCEGSELPLCLSDLASLECRWLHWTTCLLFCCVPCIHCSNTRHLENERSVETCADSAWQTVNSPQDMLYVEVLKGVDHLHDLTK